MTRPVLAPCRTCRQPVAPRADTCPGCGQARPAGGVPRSVFLVTAILGVALVAFVAWRAVTAASGLGA